MLAQLVLRQPAHSWQQQQLPSARALLQRKAAIVALPSPIDSG
jgi:hypothetical protein